MKDRLPRGLEIQGELAVALVDAAVKSARAVAAKTLRKRGRRGQTLRPGLDTPMWNALAAAVETQLQKRGERARLARILGLPRQRLTEMLRGRRLLPDAERTLTLLVWLHARQHGADLG